MIFWTKFAQNGCFPFKTEKKHHHWISHIRISLGTKCQLKLTILVFWTEFAQKKCCGSKTKSEHGHWILHIRIILSTKFQLKLTILIFFDQICPNGSFQSKTEKSHLCVRRWLLLTILNFSARAPTDTTVLCLFFF